MGRTIIQPIGPLYGEAVNGTVFGRPNGSIFVPSTNTVSIVGYTTRIRSFLVGGNYRVRFLDENNASKTFTVVAASQDNSSYIRVVLASDSDLTTIIEATDLSSGIFNSLRTNIAYDYQVEDEATYYVAAQLINNNTVIATSDIIEVTGVVPS